MRVLLVILLALVIGGGSTYVWVYYGGFVGEKGKGIAFIDTYGEYADVVQNVELLVHAPGTKGNNSRAELEDLLTKMLTEPMDASHRYELTQLAQTHLMTLKSEVDQAQSAQAALYERLQDIDQAARTFESVQLQEKAAAVVQCARERAELTARITSVLSEAQDQTGAIISRILQDQGELTQEHIQYINDTTAKAESRHETLTTLYTDLAKKQEEQAALFQAFIDAALR